MVWMKHKYNVVFLGVRDLAIDTQNQLFDEILDGDVQKGDILLTKYNYCKMFYFRTVSFSRISKWDLFAGS